MKPVLLIIGVILAGQWYKQRNALTPVSAKDTGNPATSCDPANCGLVYCNASGAWLLPDAVPQTNNCHITEAAYHQYPVDYTPAFGADPNQCGGLEVL